MKEGGPLPYAYVNNGSIWYWGTGNCFVLSGPFQRYWPVVTVIILHVGLRGRDDQPAAGLGPPTSWNKRPMGLIDHLSTMESLFFRLWDLVLINCFSINHCACITKNIFYSMDVRFNAYSPYEHIDPILKPNFHDVKYLTSWVQCFLDRFAELLTRVPLISQCRWKAS